MEKSKLNPTIVSELFSRLFASVIIVIGLIVLIGWFNGLMVLTRFSINEVPMAPSTAYVFVFLAIGLWFYLRPQKIALNRNAAIASAIIVICLSCLIVITNMFKYYANWEHAFIKIPQNQLSMQLGHMSLVTALLFIISGFALLFSLSNRKIMKTFSIIFTLVIFIISLTLLLAYGFGTPFFYFGSFIPPAVLTVLSFLFVSLTLIAASDKSTFFVKSIWKTSTSAKLLRIFLPTTIAITVIESLIIIRILPHLNIHPAIGVSLVSLIVVAVVIVIISIISKSMGKSLDSALENLNESEAKFKTLVTNNEEIIYMIDKNGIFQLSEGKALSKLSMKPGQVVGESVFEIYKDYPEMLVDIKKTLKGESLTVEHKVGDIYFSNWYTPHKNSSGEIIGLLGLSVDITARKQAENYRNLGLEILELLSKPESMHDSIQHIISTVKMRSEVDAVGIRLQDGDDFPYYYQDGFNKDFLLKEISLLNRDREGGICINSNGEVSLECTCGLVISGKTDPSSSLFTQGGSAWINDSAQLLSIHADDDPRTNPRNECVHQGYASVALVPIRAKGIIVGLIQLNDRRKGRFSVEIVELLEDIAQNIGEALMRKQTEEDLIESNKKYINLMDSLGTGVVLHAPDTSIILSNPKASEILGISPEQMKGKKAIDPQWRFVRNDGTDMPLEEYPVNKALKLMKSFSDYFIGIKRPDRKHIIWVNVNASLVFDENKNIKYVTISFNDTTEQKQAEQALKKSEEQLRIITDNLPVLISQIDKNLKYTFANKYYYNIGLTQDEIIGKNVVDIIGKETFKRAYPQMQKALSGELVSFVNSHRNKNNKLLVIETHYIPYIVNDQVESFFVLAMDITKRKKAEEALIESEEKLNALFTSLTEMVVMHELVLNDACEAIDYRIIDCNKVFAKVTGIRKADAIGKLASKVYQTYPPPYLEKYAKVALGGDPQEFTTYYPPLDKHLMISVVSPQAGKFATITTDISDMMQIQEMIMTKNKEMENYLYVASHDLRTPLVNIQGFSQRLKTQADSIKTLVTDKIVDPEILHQLANITDENIPKTLNFIFTNIEKMDTLINGLLQLSRTGRVEMNIQKIDMNKLFTKILHGLDFQVNEAQCEIHINPLPECYGDAALLDQLFTNIINNALNYYDKGRPLEITVDAKNIFNKVVYTISDTGKGIAQKHLNKIWDIFYRIDPKSDKAGEGIGLSLVKQIVEKHKGKIWVESEKNKGSVFHIELNNREFTKI